MFDLHPMRALFLMTKKKFVPPTLKHKGMYAPLFVHRKSSQKVALCVHIVKYLLYICTIELHLWSSIVRILYSKYVSAYVYTVSTYPLVDDSE